MSRFESRQVTPETILEFCELVSDLGDPQVMAAAWSGNTSGVGAQESLGTHPTAIGEAVTD